MRISDTLGDFGDARRADESRAALGRLLDQFEVLNSGFISERYSTRSRVTPASFVAKMITKLGCRDIYIYIAGSGYKRGGGRAVNLGTTLSRNKRVEVQDITDIDLSRLMRAHPEVTFKVTVDAPSPVACSIESIGAQPPGHPERVRTDRSKLRVRPRDRARRDTGAE